MEKPVIFLSHSSRDKEYISLLRNMLLTKTAKTIEIFQSSDGESIPFGNNWLHKIEEKLNNAKIMLVFVSPQSLKSNWIYFESGFSYSKGVKVIPIGINGINIGELSPPINLLQGFNITSHESLNNILLILNREFQCEFNLDFIISDYEKLIQSSNLQNISKNRNFNDIDYISYDFHSSIGEGSEVDVLIKEEAIKEIEAYFIQKKIEFRKDHANRYYLHGMLIYFVGPDANFTIRFHLDAFMYDRNRIFVEELKNRLYMKNNQTHWCRVYFAESKKLITDHIKLSSRLYDAGITMAEKHILFSFNNLMFNLNSFPDEKKISRPSLRIIYNDKDSLKVDIFELINLLTAQGIIF